MITSLTIKNGSDSVYKKITNLRIKNYSDSISSSYSGIVYIASGSHVFIEADGENNAIRLGIQPDLPSNSAIPYLKTINQLTPAPWDSAFYILGSGCTSIITKGQQLYEELSDSSLSGSITIGIFDGCVPCNNCQTIAQLQRNIQQCQIWINGLKDCNLYYEDTAAALWDKMKAKVVDQSSNHCNLTFSDQIENRRQSLRRATKLLYQYKALVALWNYLVQTKKGFMHIQHAPQDYGGYIVGSKRSITNCGENASEEKHVQLKLTMTLQSGQDITYLKNAMLESDSAPQNINYYVGKAEQNTYIQYGGDTGHYSIGDTAHDPNAIAFSDSLWFSSDSVSGSPQIRITATFDFTVQKGADTTLSGAVKMLPAISFRTDPTAPRASLVTLQEWADLRGGTKQLQAGKDIAQNLWLIQSEWNFATEVSNSSVFYQSRYFSTPYSKLGVSSDSAL